MATIDKTTGRVTESEANETTSRRFRVTARVKVTLNGKEADAKWDVYQKGATDPTITYGDLTGTLEYPMPIAASGGSASPTLRYSLPWTDADGNSGTLTSGATVLYSLAEDASLGLSNSPLINAQTGVVTVGANELATQSALGTVTASIELQGKTLDLTAPVYQAAATRAYDGLEVTEYSYPTDIPADGGTASPTLRYRLHWTSTSGASGYEEFDGADDYTSFELEE